MEAQSVKVWSPMQVAVFEDGRSGAGHTMVKSVAGSGKTTTLLQLLACFAQGLSILFVAFDKGIIKELKERCKVPGVDISTLHGLGFKALCRAMNLRGPNVVDKLRMNAIVDRVTGADNPLAPRAGELRREVREPRQVLHGAHGRGDW